VPEYVRKENKDNRAIVQQSLPVPWDDVRLVYPLRDQQTGHFEDVVVDKVMLRGTGWIQHPTGRREYRKGLRFLPGVNTALEWPKTEEPETAEGFDDDTLRLSVDEVTHSPYLLQPPMPPSVIDELRNKYSIFRSRHEESFIAAKNAQDVAAKRRDNLSRLVSTPLAELKEQQRQKRLEDPPRLTGEQLAGIGKVMAEAQVKPMNKKQKLKGMNELSQQ
jgi:large subunit ribosomal protein L24